MNKAYKSSSRLFYDPATGTLAIAGTSSLGDVGVDLTLLVPPVFRQTGRYRRVRAAIERWHPTQIIGHSLGAAAASAAADEYQDPALRFRLYGAPRITTVEHDNRITSFRHPLDPVAMFDGAAVVVPYFGWNPHSYRGF